MNRGHLVRRLLQAALVLTTVGTLLGGLAIWSERRAAAGAAWHDPADSLEASNVAPDLALLSLAGIPDEQVLALAMEKAELDTVHALLALSPDLSDRERTTGWLWLAYRYQSGGQAQQAAQAYRLAGYGAVLSPDLPDLLRTETLLAAGKQLAALHDLSSARFFLRQAATIGAHARHLSEHQRRALLERLIPPLVTVGGEREDWIVLHKAVKSGNARSANITMTAPQPGQQTGVNADLVRARGARKAAAAAMLARLVAGDGASAARETLRQALLAEEAAVAAYVSQAGDNNPAATETWLNWLLFQRRIAAGGAGDDLMPEWAQRRDEIDAALRAAWSVWTAQHTGAPAARQAIMAAYWGLYPQAPVAELVTAANQTPGSGALRLATFSSDAPPLLGWRDTQH